MSSLLSRFAESSFWMARYMERAENLARILDVNETFARDSDAPADWLPVVQLQSDDKRFFARYPKADASSVIRFYVVDADSPNSIVSSVWWARENARALRHLISTEVWTHLNVFWNRVQALSPDDLALGGVSRLCASIKEGCQLHTGIAEGTLYRDQQWSFYRIGKLMERADQTTRLLDIKYHRLLPSAADVGTPLDHSQWNALLRSAAGYQAFRRVRSSGMRGEHVVDFMLFDPALPRSVATCIAEIHRLVEELAEVHRLKDVEPLIELVEDLRAHVAASSGPKVLTAGLHEYLDELQLRLIALTNALGQRFFGWAVR